MHGISGSSAGHAISTRKINNAFAHCNHGPCTAVAETRRLIEPAAHRLNRREQSITLHLADDFPHEIRPRTALSAAGSCGQIPRKLALYLLRLSTLQRAPAHNPGSSCGAGTSATETSPRAGVLQNLFHAVADSTAG